MSVVTEGVFLWISIPVATTTSPEDKTSLPYSASLTSPEAFISKNGKPAESETWKIVPLDKLSFISNNLPCVPSKTTLVTPLPAAAILGTGLAPDITFKFTGLTGPELLNFICGSPLFGVIKIS